MKNLLKTPLYERQKSIKSKNVSFCGWDMPMSFDGIIAEHKYCRDDVALFDTSHMGELIFKGDINSSGINEATTINIDKLKTNRCKYGFLLNEDGGIIDDLIIYKLDDDEIMLVVNASRKDIDFDTLKSRIKSGSLTDKSQEIAKLDIQGKNSKKVLKKYFNDDINELKFFSFIQTKIFGKDCILSRTGYTGELGFEIYLDGETSIKLWDSLLKDGVKPAGLGARDLLRLEMGYSLYGNDLTQDITPLEANLKHFIDFEYDFFGKESLVKQKNHLKRILMPFKTTSRRSARKDFEVYQGDQKIGFVTSASYSPILNYGIGFAMVDIDGFDENKSFALKDKRGSIEANKTKIPFIKK